MYIKRYIECNYAPEICNLNCEYCYLTQENRKKQKEEETLHSPQFVRKALSKKRLGGICFISLSAAGETMYSTFLLDVAKELLQEGHFVNITTNGTVKKAFDLVDSFPENLCDRLLFTFSFHYIELKQRNLLDLFWENVLFAKSKGCSICVKLNLTDSYIPYLPEIMEICEKRIGAKPMLEFTRKIDRNGGFHIYSKYSMDNYMKRGKNFDSELFSFTCKNFRINRKNYFCYAGDWSAVVDLKTGEMTGCYCDYRKQNIYTDINKKITFEPIGYNCEYYCHNGQHFLAWGVIPELEIPSYADLRRRDKWQSDIFLEYCGKKLNIENRELNPIEKKFYDLKYKIGHFRNRHNKI